MINHGKSLGSWAPLPGGSLRWQVPLQVWDLDAIGTRPLCIKTRLREHLPWRVDSVNLPCRSKVVSFLKVANAATLPPLVATLGKMS